MALGGYHHFTHHYHNAKLHHIQDSLHTPWDNGSDRMVNVITPLVGMIDNLKFPVPIDL